MKYSIEGFSQQKLLEYGLDPIDAILLRWFTDFVATGSMRKTIINGNVYYWVHYKTVLNEFPCMKLTNPRSISNRFEKYVKVGLLLRHSEKTQKGTYTFYAIVDRVLKSLIYIPGMREAEYLSQIEDSLPFLQAKNNSSASSHMKNNTSANGISQAKINSPASENIDLYRENEENKAQMSLNSVKNREKQVSHTKENSSASSQVNEKCSAQAKNNSSAIQSYPSTNIDPTTTVSSNDLEAFKNSLIAEVSSVFELFVDKINNFNPSIDSSHTKENSSAKALQENFDYCAEKSISQAKNNSSAKGSEQFSFYKEVVGAFFDTRVFSSDLWTKLDELYINENWTEEDFRLYIQFVNEKVKEKKPASESNYFYKVVTTPSFVAMFLENQALKKKVKEIFVHKKCLACGNEYYIRENACPFCELDQMNENKSDYIEFHKALFTLDKEKKELLEKELVEFHFTAFRNGKRDQNKIKEEEKLIYEKYGLLKP